MRRFAEDTAVPISRSREEIMRLLRDWKASRIAWADDFQNGRAILQFVWTHDEADYGAEIAIQLETDEALMARSKHAQSGAHLPGRFRELQERRGRREHRMLLLWIKATLNAVDAGIISAEQVFFPFLKGTDGKTVSEVLLPKMRDLLSMPASKLLGSGK